VLIGLMRMKDYESAAPREYEWPKKKTKTSSINKPTTTEEGSVRAYRIDNNKEDGDTVGKEVR